MFVMAEEEVGSSYCGDWLARVVYDEQFHRVAARLRKEMEEGRAMDTRVWEQLSMDLIEKTIASLPFPILFRCRAVCRSWATFIFSPKFQAIRSNGLSWADLSPHVSHLLLFLSIGDTLACTAFCPDLNRWLSLPAMPCLPTQVKDVVASDGGLLCFRDRNSETGATCLFICNPITQECRKLPDMLIVNAEPGALGYVWIFVQLLVDRSSSGTYALVVGLYDHRMRAYLEVYSSITNAWTTDTTMPLHNLGVFFNPQNGALCNNVLYCVVTERVEADGAVDLFTLPTEPLYVRYLVSTDMLGHWTKLRHLRTEKRPLHVTNMHVVECLESVYMVVGEWVDYAASLLEITVFLLLPGPSHAPNSQQEKVEVTKLSQTHCIEGWQLGYQLRSYACIGMGESIFLLDLTSFLLLAYNVKRHVWKWLPQCPFSAVKHIHHLSLTNVHRNKGQPKPKGCLFSEVSFQPSHYFLMLLS